MSPIALGLGVCGVAAMAGAVAGCGLPERLRPAASGTATALAGAGALSAGLAAVSGGSWSATVPGMLPLGSAEFAVDALSGAFLVIVGLVAVATGVYATAYGRPGGHHPAPQSRTAHAVLPVFVAAMAAVPAAASVTTLLLAWELMALASLVLVLAEYRSRTSVASAGRWYAAMSQAGFAAILGALAAFSAQAGGEGFAVLREAGPALSAPVRDLVFLLALAGFGSKAGLVPLHVWLPRAHPEAPSHVSALMSAAMVKLGVYGLVRVWFDLLGGGPRWWALLVLAAGATSALYGALQAMACTDLKRLLGYSTTEHVGIVLVGVGAAGLLAAEGERSRAGLLLAAALLHALNHAAFKSLLFQAAGAAVRATGVRDLDDLGGLARAMPATTAFMAYGCLAAAALPLGNGFVSEWLLLQGLIHGPGGGAQASVLTAVAAPLAVAAVALTAGLGVAAFVKAFGVGFLARPRSAAAAAARECPAGMRAGMALAAAACLTLALAPGLAAGPLARAVATGLGAEAPVDHNALGLRLSGIAGSMSPLVLTAGVLSCCAAIGALAHRLAGRRPRREAIPWGCGGVRLDPRAECTATAFAEPLTRVFADVLAPETDLTVTPRAESRYILDSVRFRRRVPDRVEARLYPPVLRALERWGRAARALADGSVHRYAAYGFAGLLLALLLLGTAT